MQEVHIGSILVIVLTSESTFQKSFNLALIMTPLFADAFTCIIRRYFKGQNIFKPHKLHLYQRLYQAGLSHRKISLIYISATLYLSIIFLFGNNLFLYLSSFLIVLVGIILDSKLAVSFNN